MSTQCKAAPAAVRDRVTSVYFDRFGELPPIIVQAPGRVNLIGEHTDYNGGFVMPMAINRAVWIALRPRTDSQVRVWSIDYNQEASFDARTLERGNSHWAEYLKGVAWSLREESMALKGWEGVLGGDVPVGAGLSSSAALEMATARAFAAVSGLPWDSKDMALLGQRAENKWVGVNCGIMDQLISAAGRAGHALLIDCQSLAIQPLPLPAETAVVVMDTSTRRGLETSAYNERRAQCEAAAAHFGVVFLRELSVETFLERQEELDAVTRRRARHVVMENARTLQAADAMRAGDAPGLGRLMIASHDSLRDDFEVSSRELNLMVELALADPGCHGARMTGAGFGGCAVALVDEAEGGRFAASVARAYQERTGLEAGIYICRASDGAGIVD